jgi:hypothetical protein
LLSSLEWIFIDLIISYVHNIQSVLGWASNPKTIYGPLKRENPSLKWENASTKGWKGSFKQDNAVLEKREFLPFLKMFFVFHHLLKWQDLSLLCTYQNVQVSLLY